MRIFLWSLAALVFGVAGMWSIAAEFVALACLCAGVYEMWRRDNNEK